MVVPAVASPAAPTGNEPAAAPAAADPPSSAPASPQGDPNAQGNPPSGQEPAGGGDPKASAGNGNEPSPKPEEQQPKPTRQEPRRLTVEEWQAQELQRQRTQETANQDKEARELYENGKVTIRDHFDTLAEKLDYTIPSDLREPIISFVGKLIDNARRGAELKYEDDYGGLKDTLDATSRAFLDSFEDDADYNKFVSGVKGQRPETWVKTYDDLRAPKHEAAGRQKLTDALANKFADAADKAAFTESVKGQADPEKIAQAFHDQLLKRVGPAGEPSVAARAAANGRPSLAEVTQRRARGEYASNEEFLEAQNAALKGT